MLELINEQGEAITEAGDFTLAISGSLPTQRALTLGASAPVRVKLTLE